MASLEPASAVHRVGRSSRPKRTARLELRAASREPLGPRLSFQQLDAASTRLQPIQPNSTRLDSAHSKPVEASRSLESLRIASRWFALNSLCAPCALIKWNQQFSWLQLECAEFVWLTFVLVWGAAQRSGELRAMACAAAAGPPTRRAPLNRAAGRLLLRWRPTRRPSGRAGVRAARKHSVRAGVRASVQARHSREPLKWI